MGQTAVPDQEERSNRCGENGPFVGSPVQQLAAAPIRVCNVAPYAPCAPARARLPRAQSRRIRLALPKRPGGCPSLWETRRLLQDLSFTNPTKARPRSKSPSRAPHLPRTCPAPAHHPTILPPPGRLTTESKPRLVHPKSAEDVSLIGWGLCVR